MQPFKDEGQLPVSPHLPFGADDLYPRVKTRGAKS